MINFLWDINIKDIPLGWNDVYKEALKDYPNGKRTTIILSSDKSINGSAEEIVFFDPVGYRDKLINLFNEYKIKASNLYSSLNFDNIQKNINDLIKYDAYLYSLLNEWTVEGYDYSTLNPNNIVNINNQMIFDEYFNSFAIEKFEYDKYKFIQL